MRTNLLNSSRICPLSDGDFNQLTTVKALLNKYLPKNQLIVEPDSSLFLESTKPETHTTLRQKFRLN